MARSFSASPEFGAIFSQKLLFFSLEWQAVPDEHVAQILDDPAIGKYRHYLEAERRFTPHTLTEAEEKILVESSVNGRSAWVRFFTQLTGSLTCVVDGEEKLFTLALGRHQIS
jgi:oligoendopeptidase F